MSYLGLRLKAEVFLIVIQERFPFSLLPVMASAGKPSVYPPE